MSINLARLSFIFAVTASSLVNTTIASTSICDPFLAGNWHFIDEATYHPLLPQTYLNGHWVRLSLTSGTNGVPIREAAAPIEGIAIAQDAQGIWLLDHGDHAIHYAKGTYRSQIETRPLHLALVPAINLYEISSLASLRYAVNRFSSTQTSYVLMLPSGRADRRPIFIAKSLELLGGETWPAGDLSRPSGHFKACPFEGPCIEIPLDFLNFYDADSPVMGFALPFEELEKIPELRPSLQIPRVLEFSTPENSELQTYLDSPEGMNWQASRGPIHRLLQLEHEAQDHEPQFAQLMSEVPASLFKALIAALDARPITQLHATLNFLTDVDLRLTASDDTKRKTLESIRQKLIVDYFEIYNEHDPQKIQANRAFQTQFTVPEGGSFVITRDAIEAFRPRADFMLNGHTVNHIRLDDERVWALPLGNTWFKLQIESFTPVGPNRLYTLRLKK